MAQFQINGVTITGLGKDPVIQYDGRDQYGVQGNGRRIYGPYAQYTAQWAVMTDSEFSTLMTQVDSAAGNRRSVTIPRKYSTAWELQSADLEVGGGWQRDYRGYVRNVTLIMRRVST